ncbi:MAG: HAMP domain-containing sensor histidine kinase [Pseudomonadota bacterium]
MTGEGHQPGQSARIGLFKGLSGRVLTAVLAISLLFQVFVVAAVLTNRWTDGLSERLAAALVAVFVQEAAVDDQVSEDLRSDLLMVAGVSSIALKTQDYRQLVLTSPMPGPIDARIDLRTAGFFQRFLATMQTLRRGGEGTLQVVGPIQKMPGEFIEILLPEKSLYDALIDVLLGGVIAAFALAIAVGASLFFVLSRLLVRPVASLAQSMALFAQDPESPSNTLTAWNRYDEIGVAARSLRDLQIRLRNLLGEKRRLADLGAAVARINHDLRNLFATMQLVSDTLERVEDPRVQRAAPRLVRALERGIGLCQSTLDYGSTGTSEANVSRQAIAPIAREALEQFVLQNASLSLSIEVPQDLKALCDSDHVFRILTNLARNAVHAMDADEAALSLSAHAEEERVVLTLCDTGPGIDDAAKESLFTAFSGSTSKGGSGLGLALSRELARAMDGDLTLVRTGPQGTCFALTLPQ